MLGKISLMFLSLFLVATLSSCGKFKQESDTKTQTVTQKDAEQTSNNEAYSATKEQVLPKHFVYCGNDRIYTRTGTKLIEIRGSGYETIPDIKSLTETSNLDLANGISWRGNFTLAFTEMHRTYDPFTNIWSVYQEGSGVPDTFDLAKVDGQWICKTCQPYVAPNCEKTVFEALKKGEKTSAVSQVGDNKCSLGFILIFFITFCFFYRKPQN